MTIKYAIAQFRMKMAIWRRNEPWGVIIHFDCGSQYCSMASWNHSFKVEAIHGAKFLKGLIVA